MPLLTREEAAARGLLASEEYRNACEVRLLATWSIGRALAFINGVEPYDTHQRRGVRQIRGDDAADRLLVDVVNYRKEAQLT